MLPYVVIFLGIVYLILQYSGVFDDLAGRSGGSAGGSRKRGGRRLSRGIDQEIESRLKVFEDFLKKDEPPQDEP